MALEDKFAQHDKVVVDKFHDPVASYFMTSRDYVLRPSAIAAPVIIFLPPVWEAKGRFYSIVARGSAPPVNVIYIDHRSDSECWDGIITMNAKCDRVLMYSDGLTWFRLSQNLVAGTTTAPPTTSRGQTTAPPTTAAPTTGIG